ARCDAAVGPSDERTLDQSGLGTRTNARSRRKPASSQVMAVIHRGPRNRAWSMLSTCANPKAGRDPGGKPCSPLISRTYIWRTSSGVGEWLIGRTEPHAKR